MAGGGQLIWIHEPVVPSAFNATLTVNIDGGLLASGAVHISPANFAMWVKGAAHSVKVAQGAKSSMQKRCYQARLLRVNW